MIQIFSWLNFWKKESGEETYFACVYTPSAHVQVDRILIMDGGVNGIKTLREFSKSEEYFITILDDNQTKDRKFKHIREETEYEYGKANLTDCQIELLDSAEKDYIFYQIYTRLKEEKRLRGKDKVEIL